MKKELSKEDSEMYMKIVQKGTVDDMFDWAFKVGEIHCLKEQLEKIQKELKKD